MFTFSIDSENRITAFDDSGADEAPEGGIQFRSEKEWEELAKGWPTARLVSAWNGIPGAAEVKKFTNRQTALARIWKALQTQPPLKRITRRAIRREPVSSKHAGEIPKLAQARRKIKSSLCYLLKTAPRCFNSWRQPDCRNTVYAVS